MDTTLIILNPSTRVRRWIDSSNVAPYTSWNDRLEIPADSALALCRALGNISTEAAQQTYQAMANAAVGQRFIQAYNGQWFPVIDGERSGFGWSGRLGAMEGFFGRAVALEALR